MAKSRRPNYAQQLEQSADEAIDLPNFADVFGADLPDTITVQNAIRKNGAGVQIGNFALSATGLTIDGDIDHEQWLAFFEALRSIQQALQWIIGDWLVYGIDRKWGETYEKVSEFTGLKVNTLQDYAYVAKSVQTSIRIEELSFAHHQVVASMQANEQRRWLNHALENKLSVAKLRAVVNGEQLPAGDDLAKIQQKRMRNLFTYVGKSRSGHLTDKERETALKEVAQFKQWLASIEDELSGDK